MTSKQCRLLAAGLVALATGYAPARADDGSLTVLAIDVSTSSPFLNLEAAADRLAGFMKDEISGSEVGDEFHITTLARPGFYDQINLRARVGSDRHSRPRTLSRGARDFLASIPARYSSGDLVGVEYTAIIDYLENVGPSVCGDRGASLILATDGEHWTRDFNGQAFMNGEINLPAPSGAYLTGCKVVMLGLGASLDQGISDGLYARIAPQWVTFLEAAGAQSVEVYGTRFGS